MFAFTTASLRFSKLLSFKILRPFARSSLSLKEGSTKRAQDNSAIKLKLEREEKIEEANDFSPQQNACQNYILTAKDQGRLTDIYEHFRDEMNLVNQATFLHRLSLLQAQDNKTTHPESIDEIISSLTKQLPLMKEQTVSIFLSDLLRLKRLSPEILLQVASQTQVSSWKHSIAHISMILSALADENDLKKREILKGQKRIQEEQNQQEQQQQHHQFVSFAKNRLLEIKGHIPPDILAETFSSFGRLGFKNEELTTYIEAQIYRSSQQFNLQNLQKVFECYERKYYPKNIEVLDALSGRFMDLGKHLKVKDISRILTSCSNLNYVNQILFEYIEKQLIRRIKSSIVAQNKDISEDAGISLIEKYAQQSKSYSEEELELFRNLMGQSQQQQSYQQEQQAQVSQESSPQGQTDKLSGNNSEVKNDEQLLKQQDTKEKQIKEGQREELEEDYECEVLDIQTDAESILQFQKDFENQKNLIESNKNANLELIEKYKIKTHRYDQVQELNLQVASEILSAFCKLKVVKKELFELLETNFSLKIQAAKSSDIIIHAYAHSLLCQEMQHEYSLPQNSYLKRSLKNIRKFNQNFFEIVLPEVESKLDSFSIQDIQTILLSAGANDIKKRAINRRLHSLATETIDKLFEINDLSPEARAQLIYQHYQLSIPFAITQELQREFVQKLEEKKIPLQLLINRYSHLIPRPHLPNSTSNNSEKQRFLQQPRIESNQQVSEESKQ